MSESTLSEFVERKDFSRIRTSIDIPDLIEIQKRSYEEFLQMEVEPDRRKDQGFKRHWPASFPSRTTTIPRRWSSPIIHWGRRNTMSGNALSRE